MPALADWQAQMAQGLLHGALSPLEAGLIAGPVPAARALQTHHDTAHGGLIAALRLTYPTVDWLVGEAFFDQAAHAYARRHPPRSVWLDAFGGDFPDFLAAYAPAAEVPYLADAARFDRAVDAAVGQSPHSPARVVALDPSVDLHLAGSLVTLDLAWPADRLRDAHADPDADLTALDLEPGRYAYAIWRGGEGALARRLSGGPAAFLRAVLAEGTAEAGLAALLEAAGEAGLAALQAEVFAAPFARLQTMHNGEDIQ